MDHHVREGPSRGLGLTAFRRSPGFEGPVEPVDDHEHANGHYAVIYETDEERFAATVPFVREGLERNEHCIVVVEDRTEETDVIEAFRRAGLDVEEALESGQLAFYTTGETYLRGGSFDPDEMIAFYEATIEEALLEHEGLRVAAGTGWIEEVSLEAFMEYEGRVNRLFDDHEAMALCHYDRSELAADVIRDVVHTHPHLIYDGQVCHNFYYVPSDEHVRETGREVNEQMLQTLRDRSRAKTELVGQKRFLRELNEVTADPERSFEEKLMALFELGCAQFDLDMGGLNRVDREADRFEVEYLSDEHEFFEPGMELPLSETYCRAPAEAMDTAGVSDPVADGFDDIAVYEEWGARAYLGTYISVEGREDRTFAFIGSEPREEPFSEEDRTLIELMAQWVKYELERERRERELGRSNDKLAALNHLYSVVHDVNRELVGKSTREAIERVVCERLAASNSYAFAWIGHVEGDEVVPSTSVGDRGSLDDVAVDGVGRGPYGRAVRTGETQVVRDVATDDRFESPRAAAREDVSALAAVPIAYEDERYGVLSVYTDRDGAFDDEERDVVDQLGEIAGLAIAAAERERELEYERERLEFFNRLIRHNLLNSLNVVQARADILDAYVDPTGRQHVDVVKARTDDMIDLIETLRSLMRAIVGGADRELEPVDVGVVLEEEFRRAARTYERAEFRIEGRPDEAGTVLANDLLAEAFENLLTNAVQHNDKAVPEVTVSADREDEMTVVRIADNGPGIPDEQKERVFQKGEKGFESPGSGFGLHLVREIVEAYDGEISVADNDPEGTVFVISLPRAPD